MEENKVVYENDNYRIITDSTENPTTSDVAGMVNEIEYFRAESTVRRVILKFIVTFSVCTGLLYFLTTKGIIEMNLVSVSVFAIIVIFICLKSR